jgi:uncharacterized protein involved in outer membrane biogenesis
MMRKLFYIIAASLVVIVTLLTILPLLFKDRVVQLLKTQVNKNINATLDFDDIGLNLFSNFPDFTLTIENVVISNHAPFAGDTLLQMVRFDATLALLSLLRGNTIEVVKIELDKPDINLVALEDGTVNWDIQKASEEPVAPAPPICGLRQTACCIMGMAISATVSFI